MRGITDLVTPKIMTIFAYGIMMFGMKCKAQGNCLITNQINLAMLLFMVMT